MSTTVYGPTNEAAITDAFVQAFGKLTNQTRTVNGSTAYRSTLSGNLSFFSAAGAMRNSTADQVKQLFDEALEEDEITAVANLLRLRNVRGGQGERDVSRLLFAHYISTRTLSTELLDAMLHYGRADDLWLSFDHKEELRYVAKYIATIFKEDKRKQDITNLAKWLPRKVVKTKKADVVRTFLSVLRSELKLTPKQYRQLLVTKSNTVEQLLCSGQHDNINYSTVPSRAMHLYKNAFERNSPERFNQWLESIKVGKDKVNSTTLYPYEVLRTENVELAQAQWLALPNYFEGKDDVRILPIIDVSGSMTSRVKNMKYTCMDVAVGLGLYLTYFNTSSALRGMYGSFSEHPTFYRITHWNDIKEVARIVYGSDWGYSTNLLLTFTTLFESMKQNNVPQEQMPEMVVILTDMNFNAATDRKGPMEDVLKELATQYGYQLPKMVFWNLNHNGSFGITIESENICQVSGFSPSIMKEVLADIDNLNPLSVMHNALTPYLTQAGLIVKICNSSLDKADE